MKLTKADIRNYRSIESSDVVHIEDSVTCLVGKNESGKTAFLQAMYKANPFESTVKYDEIIDFPSRLTRMRHETDGPIDVATLTFSIEEPTRNRIEAELGAGVLKKSEFSVTSAYRRTSHTYILTVNEQIAVSHLLGQLTLDDDQRTMVAKSSTITKFVEVLESLENPDASVTAMIARIKSWRDSRLSHYIYDTFISPEVPKMVYFDEYDVMPGKVSIPNMIQKRDTKTLNRGETSLLALLDVVSVKLEDFQDPSKHEYIIREMENAANSISDEVFEYWTQNRDLAVKLEILVPEQGAVSPLDQGPILMIRIWNNRHRVSVPFDERSRGFVWFFSFLSYFSQVKEAEGSNIILLLDEPGLSLHATAQGDLLRFIDEKLAPFHQVIYTTHSPFMINPSRIERTRTVMDKDLEGTKISSNSLLVDAETAFPLQAALGYSLAQTLFLGPDNLLVEGPTDLIFIEILNELAREAGLTTLDPRWVIVPVRGAGKLATFVTLLGANQMNSVVLRDSSSSEKQTIDELVKLGRIKSSHVIAIGSIVGRSDCDIEDLFDESTYLEAVNLAYSSDLATTPITSSDLPPGDRITRRIEAVFNKRKIDGGKLNHYRPALSLLRNQSTLANPISPATLQLFSDLATAINPLLS
jgi:hypothetical protein